MLSSSFLHVPVCSLCKGGVGRTEQLCGFYIIENGKQNFYTGHKWCMDELRRRKEKGETT